MWRELQRVTDTDTGIAALRAPAEDCYFALFGLAPSYAIDLTLLRERFGELQRQLHPDRYVQTSEAERQASVLMASRVNDAYTTLRDPLERARYLLRVQGIDTTTGCHVTLPAAFLQAQIEWREAFEEAKSARDRNAFEVLTARLREETRSRYEELAIELADRADSNAARVVLELQFLERLAADVVEAMDQWESG